MDIVHFPIGSDADANLSLEGGKLILQVELHLQKEIDDLLDTAIAKFPQAAPFLELAKAAVDAELGKS